MTNKTLSLKDPQIQIALITIAVILVTYYSAQKFIVKPQRKETAGIEKQLQHIDLENQIISLRQHVDSHEKSLSPQKESTWLLTEITGLAQQAHLNVVSVQPQDSKTIPPYTYISYKITITCSNKQLLRFIQFTETSKYLILLERLNITAPKDYKLEFTEKEFTATKPVIVNVEITLGTVY